MINTFS